MIVLLRRLWNHVLITQFPQTQGVFKEKPTIWIQYTIQKHRITPKTKTNCRLTVTRQRINPPIINIKIKTWFSDFHQPKNNNFDTITKLRQEFFLLVMVWLLLYRILGSSKHIEMDSIAIIMQVYFLLKDLLCKSCLFKMIYIL